MPTYTPASRNSGKIRVTVWLGERNKSRLFSIVRNALHRNLKFINYSGDAFFVPQQIHAIAKHLDSGTSPPPENPVADAVCYLFHMPFSTASRIASVNCLTSSGRMQYAGMT